MQRDIRRAVHERRDAAVALGGTVLRVELQVLDDDGVGDAVDLERVALRTGSDDRAPAAFVGPVGALEAAVHADARSELHLLVVGRVADEDELAARRGNRLSNGLERTRLAPVARRSHGPIHEHRVLVGDQARLGARSLRGIALPAIRAAAARCAAAARRASGTAGAAGARATVYATAAGRASGAAGAATRPTAAAVAQVLATTTRRTACREQSRARRQADDSAETKGNRSAYPTPVRKSQSQASHPCRARRPASAQG